MDFWLAIASQMIGGHHHPKRPFEGTRRVGQERGDTGERFDFFRIKNMQGWRINADEERVAGPFPSASGAPDFLRGIDQDVGDVLDVANFEPALCGLPKADCTWRLLDRWG
ncbi:MAG: hypothetical protein AcusKO_42270 [Acuticoccus sp.]